MMRQLTILRVGCSTEHEIGGGFGVVTMPLLVYDDVSDVTLVGVAIEGEDEVTYLSAPCEPIAGWRSIPRFEKTEVEVRDGSVAVMLDNALEGGEVNFETLNSLIKAIIASPAETYPTGGDIVAIWDSLPSVRMRTDLAYELRRAMSVGELEMSGEVLRRLDDFEKSHRLFSC